ncbi:MAG: sigma-70 family RNA polymerase sigma factor [Planctomycetota bacterium]
MAKVRLQAVASLARQMAFVPVAKRLQQIAAAEDLLLRIDAETGYPLDFVVHAITGFRGKDNATADGTAELLTGDALQHDLGLLCETVSEAMNLPADDAGEPVLGIADVCDRFGVTSKTIQRWRRRGLPARRWQFEDGKSRVGFLLSSVERFVANQSGSAERPAGTEPLTDCEQAYVIRKASLLAAAGHDRQEIIRRVARRAGRSSLAIQHNLEHHDRQSPAVAVLDGTRAPMSAKQAAQAVARIESGNSIVRVAAELDRPRVAIYRAWMEHNAEKLSAAAVKFHDDELYHGDDHADIERQIQTIVDDAFAQRDNNLAEEATPESRRVPRNLPPYLADLYRTPLLTPKLERALFLQFNYYKCRFSELRSKLDPHLCKRADQRELQHYLDAARAVKNQITQANLRLVVSVARKHLRPGLDIMELISDGNIVLMRAVEGFDIHKGFRFSTYATLALMKGFARSVPAMQADQAPAHEFEADLFGKRDHALERIGEREQLASLLEQLEPRERHVLSARWGLEEQGESTLETIGRTLGLTKHRVRQIEQGALGKLRNLADIAA